MGILHSISGMLFERGTSLIITIYGGIESTGFPCLTHARHTFSDMVP
jgi:hypothetical protein|uniref:Uncharacterized protein n=1 Tax=Picea glauca TaxID=3330 RepID=A0A101M026_PICGL|nr:hypothetical protein ABT39_MTgene4437 [Picea glauca]